MQRELVERARGGDHDAFAVLAGAAISRLDAAAWLILRDVEQAKDAVQNALVKAWRDLPTLRDPDSFDAWLNRLLVRACIDEARRLRRHRVDVEMTDLNIAMPSMPGFESSIADRDQIQRGFVRLTPEMRAVDRPASLPRPAVAGGRGEPRHPRGHREIAAPPCTGLMRAALDADARPRPDLAEGRPT
jgi:DNA-directed RNA polymerase specialized sigma24 family protein